MKLVFLHGLLSLGLFCAGISFADDEAHDEIEFLRVERDYGGKPGGDLSKEEVYLELKGGKRLYLTKNKFIDRVPLVSPANSEIVFMRKRDTNGDGQITWSDTYELWLIDLRTRKERQICKALVPPGMPSWHAQERKLAVIGRMEDEQPALYIYDLERNSYTLVSRKAESWPTWSPDGKRIAFYDTENRVATVPPNKNAVEKVLSDNVGNGWGLYWTSDNRLLFTHERNGWLIFERGTPKPIKMPEDQREPLTTIDQAAFGWATPKAEQDAGGKRD